MNEQIPTEDKKAPLTTEMVNLRLRLFKEYFTAGIAIMIVLGFIILAVIAVNTAVKGGADSTALQGVKDILLVINPFVGAVFGFYFSKTTSEARAENAETQAQNAAVTAQQATKERDTAKEEADKAKGENVETKAVLANLEQAAHAMMTKETTQEGTGGMRTLSGGSPEMPAESKEYYDMQSALERARRWREK